MATSRNTIPFSQTVGCLIDYLYANEEDGDATALAIRAHFGSYCECNMAQWIIDGIENANAAMLAKLRLLLAADPYAVIDRIVRQSPPEKLMRRFCETGALKGAYRNITGNEVITTLEAESSLCPPAPTEAPEVEYYIQDSLTGNDDILPVVDVDEYMESLPLAARIQYQLSGPAAAWGTTIPTAIKITARYDGAAGWMDARININGVFVDTVRLNFEEDTVWYGTYSVTPSNNYLMVQVIELQRHIAEQNVTHPTFGCVIVFPTKTLPIVEYPEVFDFQGSNNNFIRHRPEIGEPYKVRMSRSELDTAWAYNAEKEQDSTGLFWYGNGRSFFTNQGLKLITAKNGGIDNGQIDPVFPDFLDTSVGNSSFPPTHWNTTVIPQSNIETGITIRVPRLSPENEAPRGNWPSTTCVALVFDTNGGVSFTSSPLDVGRSYENGYGSALVLWFGNNVYGNYCKAKLYCKRDVSPNSDSDHFVEKEVRYLSGLFNNYYWNKMSSSEQEFYRDNGEFKFLAKTPELPIGEGHNNVFNELKLAVRIYNGQLCIVVNDHSLYALSDYGAPRDTSYPRNLRCGFYVGGFVNSSWAYIEGTGKDYLLATDYYVKPFDFENTTVNLFWATTNNNMNNLTLQQRSANNAILIGVPWPNKANEPAAPVPFDHTVTIYPQTDDTIGIDFSITTIPGHENDLEFYVEGFEELDDGTVKTLFHREVDFDKDTLLGHFWLSTGEGFTPNFYPDGYDNIVWWVELVIKYKGFIYGKCTIVYYSPHDGLPIGAYIHGNGFLAMSRINFA